MVINMKYRVAIVDKDTAYLERLVEFWEKHRKTISGASEITVDAFYSKSTFLQKNDVNHYDVVCIGDQADFEMSDLPGDIKAVYFSADEEELSQNRLKKYQKPENLYEQLLHFCENSSGLRNYDAAEEDSDIDEPVFKTSMFGNFKYRECELSKSMPLDRVALGMLKNQTVPGIALVNIQERPQSIVLKYDITGKISLHEFYNSIYDEEADGDFKGICDGHEFLTIIKSFIDTALSMDDYLMSAGNIVWDIDDLYIDEKSHEISVLYYPVGSGHGRYSAFDALMNLQRLIAGLYADDASDSYIETETDEYSQEGEDWERDEETWEQEDGNQNQDDEFVESDDSDDDEYIVTANESDVSEHLEEKEDKRHFGKNRKIGKRAVHDTGSTYASFTHEKDEYEDEEEEPELPYSVSQDMEEQPRKGLAAIWPWRGKAADRDSKREPEQKISNHRNSEHNISSHEIYYDDEDSGQTEIFDKPKAQDSYQNEENSYETTVLDKEQYVYYLLRRKNHEKIVINRPIFKLGKEKNYVDYCISDNAAVSRNHAEIIIQDGEYYIRDNDSLNHTYINGTMIPVKENVVLYEEDVIFLANESFVFKKEKLK